MKSSYYIKSWRKLVATDFYVEELFYGWDKESKVFTQVQRRVLPYYCCNRIAQNLLNKTRKYLYFSCLANKPCTFLK